MADMLVAAVSIAVLLLIWTGVFFWLKRNKRSRGEYYRVELLDLKNGSKVIDDFVLYDFSYEQTRARAYRCLKRRLLYQEDDDLREFVRVCESGMDFTAGYEFDVLPEALRRFALNISVMDK